MNVIVNPSATGVTVPQAEYCHRNKQCNVGHGSHARQVAWTRPAGSLVEERLPCAEEGGVAKTTQNTPGCKGGGVKIETCMHARWPTSSPLVAPRPELRPRARPGRARRGGAEIMNNLSETVACGHGPMECPGPVPIPLSPRQSPGAWCRRAEPHGGPQRSLPSNHLPARRAAASHRDELTAAVPDSSKTAGAVTRHLFGPTRCSIALPAACSPTLSACFVLTTQ